MKKTVRGKSIILIALIYNYLANNKTNLFRGDIERFIKAVDTSLKKSDKDYEMSIGDLEFCENFFGFIFDKKKDQYTLISSRPIEYVYTCQPEEVIEATLTESALFEIGVDRKNLKIEKQYKPESGEKDIYSLEAKAAKEKAKEILESQGCRKIVIGSAIPDMLEGDKGYHVSYSCERPSEKVNVLEKPKK